MKYFYIFLIAVTLSGCARTCEKFDRSIQFGPRNYHIVQYSGGQVVAEYKFRGMLNSSQSSDGYYWTVGDTLFEVSGDVRIMSTE